MELRKLRLLTACFTTLFFTLKMAGAQIAQPLNDNQSIAGANMKTKEKTDSFMVKLLQQYPQYFDTILANKKKWNVQVIYTQVNRGNNGIPALKTQYFNVDKDAYFYPASTVKLPISLLALQKLNELKMAGVDKYATMVTGQSTPVQTAVYNDPTTPDGRPNIAQYIRKILMVSDNDAFNRLYEFLGRKYINEQLHQKRLGDAEILHRLSLPLSESENRATNPVSFLSPNNKVLYTQPLQFDSSNYSKRSDAVGAAYYSGDSLISHPMDFSGKNRLALEDLHQVVTGLIFPDKVTASQRFNLSPDDRNFVLKYMGQLPTESTWPPYAADTASYWPAYCKFLLYGSRKGALPKNIRIFNKVGDAYGQLTDVAYIVDFDKKVEFFLSATIYCNGDGILNDDKYDYDTIGFPFMQHLGEVIYEYECKRKKSVLPDLCPFKFVYDSMK